MPDNPYLLELRGLDLVRDQRRLLADLSLSLHGHGITVIMGPNGAGKSVLLKVIHGLARPDRGTVRWRGMPLDEAIRHRQSFVFQRPVLLRRTVMENMNFVLHSRGIVDRWRAETLLQLVNLGDRANQPARRLSGGEQQRLALARALLTEPRVLLLDEPTASLDPGSAKTIEEVITAEADRGTEIILITHDAAQARRLGREIVFLHRGRVLAHQAAAEFFANPGCDAAHRYLNGEILV